MRQAFKLTALVIVRSTLCAYMTCYAVSLYSQPGIWAQIRSDGVGTDNYWRVLNGSGFGFMIRFSTTVIPGCLAPSLKFACFRRSQCWSPSAVRLLWGFPRVIILVNSLLEIDSRSRLFHQLLDSMPILVYCPEYTWESRVPQFDDATSHRVQDVDVVLTFPINSRSIPKIALKG